MRMLPFFKPKKGFMIAGGGLDTVGGGGGGSMSGELELLHTFDKNSTTVSGLYNTILDYSWIYVISNFNGKNCAMLINTANIPYIASGDYTLSMPEYANLKITPSTDTYLAYFGGANGTCKLYGVK